MTTSKPVHEPVQFRLKHPPAGREDARFVVTELYDLDGRRRIRMVEVETGYAVDTISVGERQFRAWFTPVDPSRTVDVTRPIKEKTCNLTTIPKRIRALRKER